MVEQWWVNCTRLHVPGRRQPVTDVMFDTLGARGSGQTACGRTPARTGQRGLVRRHRYAMVELWIRDDQKQAAFSKYAATPAGLIGKPENIAQAIVLLIGNAFMPGEP